MKRFLITLIFAIIIFSTFAYAEDIKPYFELKECRIINYKTDISKTTTITRKECVTQIMRVIGLTDKMVEHFKGSDGYCFADVGLYSYIGCAYLSKIAYGEERVVTEPTYRTRHLAGSNTDRFFDPERLATKKDCLAFCVRCLQSENFKDQNDLLEKAYEHNLIEKTDLENLDEPINTVEFYDILTKLIWQKRYKYYAYPFVSWGYVDEDRSMSYYNMLLNR